MTLHLIDRIDWSGGSDEDTTVATKLEVYGNKLETVNTFRSWFSSHGGYLNPQVDFEAGIFALSAYFARAASL